MYYNDVIGELSVNKNKIIVFLTYTFASRLNVKYLNKDWRVSNMYNRQPCKSLSYKHFWSYWILINNGIELDTITLEIIEFIFLSLSLSLVLNKTFHLWTK